MLASHVASAGHLARLVPVRAEDVDAFDDRLDEQSDGRTGPETIEVPVETELGAEGDGKGDLLYVS